MGAAGGGNFQLTTLSILCVCASGVSVSTLLTRVQLSSWIGDDLKRMNLCGCVSHAGLSLVCPSFS